MTVSEDGAELLPLPENTPHQIVSELSSQGKYQLSIDGKLICEHTIRQAKPLVLDVPQTKRVWAGSSWDRTPFAGESFDPQLRPGHAGLILGPMDGAAPRQNFQHIVLSSVDDAGQPPADYESLLKRIDNAPESGQLKKFRSHRRVRAAGRLKKFPTSRRCWSGLNTQRRRSTAVT